MYGYLDKLCQGVGTLRSWARAVRKSHRGMWHEYLVWHTAGWGNAASNTAGLPAHWPLSLESSTFAKLWHEAAPILLAWVYGY